MMLILHKIMLCAEIVVFVIFTFANHSAHFRRAHRVILFVNVDHSVHRAFIADYSSVRVRRCETARVSFEQKT